jgi:hypothetical protein
MYIQYGETTRTVTGYLLHDGCICELLRAVRGTCLKWQWLHGTYSVRHLFWSNKLISIFRSTTPSLTTTSRKPTSWPIYLTTLSTTPVVSRGVLAQVLTQPWTSWLSTWAQALTISKVMVHGNLGTLSSGGGTTVIHTQCSQRWHLTISLFLVSLWSFSTYLWMV